MYRVLIAEEDRYSREVLEMTDWWAFGFEDVCVASGYSEALDLAARKPFHLALIGHSLGERMGSELAVRLRSMGHSTVCCLLANQLDWHETRRVMRAGFRDVLGRPPEPQALREFLEWLLLTQFRRKLTRQQETPPDTDPVLGKEYTAFGAITNRILSVVRSDYRQPLSLTAIAQRLGMSGKYIGRVFMQETGLRFTEYLMAYRMQEASRLIRGTDEKITVVARMVGYSQPNNFYTHFHRYFGVSPSVLRGGGISEEETP